MFGLITIIPRTLAALAFDIAYWISAPADQLWAETRTRK